MNSVILQTCEHGITDGQGVISGPVQFLDTGSESGGIHVLKKNNKHST